MEYLAKAYRLLTLSVARLVWGCGLLPYRVGFVSVLWCSARYSSGRNRGRSLSGRRLSLSLSLSHGLGGCSS